MYTSLQDNFVSKLKDHLLSQLHQYDYDGDECQFGALEHNNLHFVNNLNTVMTGSSQSVIGLKGG